MSDIPDYLFHKTSGGKTQVWAGTRWLEIHHPPTMGTWRSHLRELVTFMVTLEGRNAKDFGFWIDVKFYNSMYSENVFDSKPHSNPVGEEVVGYTFLGLPVRWKIGSNG